MARVYVRLEEPEKERLEQAVKFLNKRQHAKVINQAWVMREGLKLYLNELDRLIALAEGESGS